jgi:hypothetical protein
MQAYNNGEGGYDVYYNCPIANALPFDYTGASDFVVCKPCDSASDGLPGYTFHGMLAIEVFQNGLPVSITKKESYAIVNTDRRNGIQSSLIKSWNRVAPVDTMYISAGCADTYRNYGKAFEGKNVIVVIINPDLAIHERNYDNNASSLPISIGNGSAVVDLSALDENVPHAATNLTATISKGKVKILTLNWDCPYHEPTYVYHDFTLRQDGVVIATGFDTSSYQLTLTNGQKHLYEIIINIKGLGSSPPITIKI